MKLNAILKMLPTEIILALELRTNQNVMNWLCFEFLSRILTCTFMKLNLILKMLIIETILALELNNKSKCDEMAMFQVSLQNLDLDFLETKPDTENACS